MTKLPARVGAAQARGALRRFALRAQREPRTNRPRVSPAVIEEEAASLLYGRRSGMVNASPVGPPLAEPPDPQL